MLTLNPITEEMVDEQEYKQEVAPTFFPEPYPLKDEFDPDENGPQIEASLI